MTILTDPIPWGRELLHESARRIARIARDHIRTRRHYSNHPKYRGHFAVTRSLIEGLNKIGANYNYSPLHPSRMADTVIVLAGVRTLRQAIRLKQSGLIKKLFAGPNIVVFSSDDDSVLTAPEIDWVITPSDWVTKVYVQDNPVLIEKCLVWPAGVDTNFWQPDIVTKRDRILIFDKLSSSLEDPIHAYFDYLGGLGWQVDIIKYGSFTQSQYLQLLRRSCLMLGFCRGESQGIAWAEAWSTGVATLIRKNTTNVYQGRRYDSSTAPYLCSQNGLFFDNLQDFKIQFDYWESHREQFKPREWVLTNMSDEVCTSMLYRKVTEC